MTICMTITVLYKLNIGGIDLFYNSLMFFDIEISRLKATDRRSLISLDVIPSLL